MAFAGLRKQINKANQYMSEKIGGAEGTKFTDDFVEMERKTDLTAELVDELIIKTKEYLQPNPASRAKLMVSSKLRGGQKSHAYPQPEGTLGEAMVKYGTDLGDESAFAASLIETGEALKQMADVKYALEDNVKQNFLEPLFHLQTKDLKDVQHHRKKLQGRRLDFDCKRRKQAKVGHVPDEEIKIAEDKFEESFNLASMGMYNLLQNDVEQISQLAAFAEALCEYHQQCASILQGLTERLLEHMNWKLAVNGLLIGMKIPMPVKPQSGKNEAASRPREEYQPKTLQELNIPELPSGVDSNGAIFYPVSASPARSPVSSPVNPRPVEPLFLSSTFGSPSHGSATTPRTPSRSPNASPLPSPVRSPARPIRAQPCCQALYDFDPENEGELGFKEGDIINLLSKVDDNWFEGTINGRTGLFPISYVQVQVPLP